MSNLLIKQYFFFVLQLPIHYLQQLILCNMAWLLTKQHFTIFEPLLNGGLKFVHLCILKSKYSLDVPPMRKMLPFLLLSVFVQLLRKSRNLSEEGFCAAINPVCIWESSDRRIFLHNSKIHSEILQQKSTKHSDWTTTDDDNFFGCHLFLHFKH